MGKRWCYPLGTVHTHVPRDFINSFLAPKRLVRSGLRRCHSTQFNDWNIAKWIALYSVPRATCHWHVFFGTCFISSFCARTAERIWTGQISFLPDRREHYYVVDCNMYCATWYVPITRGTCFDDFTNCSRTAVQILSAVRLQLVKSSVRFRFDQLFDFTNCSRTADQI